uniref:Uncharacterized protein n=1 Tax=viral metagenome TaxID=1070528 RepID=A0A6C0BTK9_9ZZZZ
MTTYLLRPRDYVTIADNYGYESSDKKNIEGKLARKMCRCIKKVKKTLRVRPEISRENGAIAICNKSIFRNRGLKFNRVTCKKKAKFIRNKKDGWKLAKTRRNLEFKKKKTASNV